MLQCYHYSATKYVLEEDFDIGPGIFNSCLAIDDYIFSLGETVAIRDRPQSLSGATDCYRYMKLLIRITTFWHALFNNSEYFTVNYNSCP